MNHDLPTNWANVELREGVDVLGNRRTPVSYLLLHLMPPEGRSQAAT